MAHGRLRGTSAVQTNRAEALAWTDPVDAIDAADAAIAAQGKPGDLHELGNAYTAQVIAHTRLGRLDEAAAAFELAGDALDRAAYRSGRARAELFRAFLLARQGRPRDAAASTRWAVGELVAVEAHPMLILTAACLVDLIGLSDEHVTEAAERARTELKSGDSSGAIAASITRLLGLPEMHRTAMRSANGAAGAYNRNVRVDGPAGPVNVRVPIADADSMDLRVWPESKVLTAVEPYLENTCPRLLFSSSEPAFQVHSFVTGELLDEIAPRGTRVPPHVLGDVAVLFGRLATIPRAELPAAPAGWPEDTEAFARLLSGVTHDVHARFAGRFEDVFAALGFPREPLAAVRWETLSLRPFRLVHADVHRKNMIVNDGDTVFLDWELGLWGDPVYELAVHFHKMGYLPDERDAVLDGWLGEMPGELVRGWEDDLNIYLTHERVKSAIVDTVRYTQLIAEGAQSAAQENHLLGKLTAKLAAAATIWGTIPPGRDHIERVLRSWRPPSGFSGRGDHA